MSGLAGREAWGGERLGASFLVLALLGGSMALEARRPREPKPPKVPAEVEEVQAVVGQFVQALNDCDLEKTLALFAPGATLFSPLRDRPRRSEGRGEVEDTFRELYDNVRREGQGPPYMSVTADDLKIQVVGDMALATFQMVRGPATSRRTLVLQKENGLWRILHLHGSNLRADQPAGPLSPE